MKTVKKIVNYENILILLFIVLSYILVLHHEPWRDEAQSWLIAKDLDVIGIINQMKYEGHPCLWHLILHLFTKMNFSYAIVNFVSWMITCFGVVFFVKKVNLSNIIKTFIIFSPTFLIYSAGLARSYCLVLFFIILLCYFYKVKEDHPYIYGLILFGLINSHFLSAFFVGSLLLLDIYEIIKKDNINKKSRIIYNVITLLGFLFFAIQLCQIFSVRTVGSKTSFYKIILSSILTFVNFFENNSKVFCFPIFMLMIFIAFCYLLFKNNKKMFFILILNLVFELIFFAMIYSDHYYMSVVIISIFMFCYCNSNLSYDKLFGLFFLLTIPYSIKLYVSDIKGNFSQSLNVVRYINENIPDEDIMCVKDFLCTSMVPYVSNDMIEVERFEKVRYVTWGRSKMEQNDVISYMRDNNIRYIIIADDDLIEYVSMELRLKESFNENNSILNMDEIFYLYELVD